MNYSIASISVCLFVLFGSSAGLSCYKCEKTVNCKYVVDLDITSCRASPENAVTCAKLVSKDGEVTRDCYNYKMDFCDEHRNNILSKIKGLISGDDHCESCDDDLCNGSQSLKSSLVATIFTALATCLFYMLH